MRYFDKLRHDVTTQTASGLVVAGITGAYGAIWAWFHSPEPFPISPPAVPQPSQVAASSGTSTPPPTAGPTTPPVAPRMLIQRTPRELLDMGKDMLAIERERRLAPYINQLIKLSGPVEDIYSPTLGVIAVRLRIAGKPYGASMLSFDKARWEDRLTMVQKGDSLTATCTLGSVEDFYLSLHKCELPAQ